MRYIHLRGAVSSAGRASRLHREGRRFDPVTAHHFYRFGQSHVDRIRADAYVTQTKCKSALGGVAQLVRALACHARGRGFESRHSRHFPVKK